MDFVFPAEEEDSHELKPECPKHDVAPALVEGDVMLVVRLCPFRLGYGTPGPFDDGLVEELGTFATSVNRDGSMGAPAARGDRRHACEALDLLGQLEASSIGTQQRDQTRTQGSSDTRQALDPIVFGMLLIERIQLRIDIPNGLEQTSEHAYERACLDCAGADDGWVTGE